MITLPFPAPKPASRLERDLNRSIHAENVARELAEAVFRKTWVACETHEQEQLREAAEACIRGFDETARSVARYYAVQRFTGELGRHLLPVFGGYAEVARAWELAQQSYTLHLACAAHDERPTDIQTAAYQYGISGGTE